jgi:hypothetical protein
MDLYKRHDGHIQSENRICAAATTGMKEYGGMETIFKFYPNTANETPSLSSVASHSNMTENKIIMKEPLRPLSSYNYFFRDERERILKYGVDYNKGTNKEIYSMMYYTTQHQDELLQGHWNGFNNNLENITDQTKKRLHIKTHGKVTFASLSKMVSKAWKELPSEKKKFYKETALRDWDRYQTQLEKYKDYCSKGGRLSPESINAIDGYSITFHENDQPSIL